MPLEIGQEIFEILDRHPSRGSAAGDTCQVRRVQPQLIHSRLHARRHITRPGSMGRHRQAAHGWFDLLFLFVGQILVPVVRRLTRLAFSRARNVQAHARCVSRARFQIPEDRADGITLVQSHQPFFDAPAAGRGHVHGGFVGFHLDDVLIGVHLVADLDEEIDDRGFGDRLAQLRHDDGNLRHGMVTRLRC